MARKTDKPEAVDPTSIIIPVTEIADIAAERYTEFLVASNERVVPDIRDGLKPVHRRILYGFHEMGATATGRHYKSAEVVGFVMGRYHPHGDAGIYDAACKMSQDFAMRYPLIDLPGNGGSIDGDGAGASRYTEMRPGLLGDEMLRDLETPKASIVDWGGNYSNERPEPFVMPGRFPQLLCNGILTGIGTGYSAMWLPHNLREIADAIIACIDDPSVEASKLTRWIKGPDFATGGELMGIDGFKSALETGKGTVTLRAKMAFEENGRETSIVITEIPWQKMKSDLVAEIAERTNKDPKTGLISIEGIADVIDQSGSNWRTDMRVVVLLKREANPKRVAALLYKLTGLQTTFSYHQMAYVDGYPELVTFRGAIDHYIHHQMDVLTRRTNWRRKQALDALETQNAYLLADKYGNELYPLARKCKDRAELEAKIPGLIKEVTPRQAEIIAGFPLYRFSHIDTSSVKSKIAELKTEIAEYDRLLATKEAMSDLLKIELREIKAKYGDDRRTVINTSDDGEIKSMDDLIPDEACWLGLSKSGLLSRLPASAFRLQKRGGTGANAAKAEDDPFVEVLAARTPEKVWLLTDTGNLFGMRVADLDEIPRGARGTYVRKFFSGMTADERVVKLVTTPSNDKPDLIIATRDGKIIRTLVADYSNLNSGGLRAIKLLPGDAITSAFTTEGGHILIVSSDGFVSRYDLDKISPQGRGSQGVASIGLNRGAHVVAALPLRGDADNRDILTVLTNGKGKRSRLSGTEYPAKGRGIRGIIGHEMKAASKGQACEVAFAAVVSETDQVMLTCSTGKVIVMEASEIKRIGRGTGGVQVVSLSSSAKVNETVTAGAIAIGESTQPPTKPVVKAATTGAGPMKPAEKPASPAPKPATTPKKAARPTA